MVSLPSGTAKLLDFGIAHSAMRSMRTVTGLLKGKLHYMSPEQTRGEALDARSDQFSLGAVLWELCMGRRLFDGTAQGEVFRAISQPAPSPSNFLPQFPPALEAVIARSLAVKKEERFASCADLAQALDGYLASCGTPTDDRQVAEFVLRLTFPPSTAPSQGKGNFFFDLRANEVSATHLLPKGKTPPPEVVSPLSVSGPTNTVSPGSREPGKTVRPKLLYVEDEPENFNVAELRLKRKYELIWARDDRTACDLLKVCGGSFAAILMDIELKGSSLSGLDLIRLIRGSPPTQPLPPYARDIPALEVPIIVTTAYGDRFPENDLLSLGATHYAPKPVDFVKLSLALAAISIHSAQGLLRR